MHHPTPRRTFARLLALATLPMALIGCLPGETPPRTPPTTAADDPWIPLFNGKDLTGWYPFFPKAGKTDPLKCFTVHDGMIHFLDLAPGTTTEIGYLATEKSYSNFHLRFELKWGTKQFPPRASGARDSGCLYLFTGNDKVWPSSLEMQLTERLFGDLYILNNAYAMQTTVQSTTPRQKIFAPQTAAGVPYTFAGGFLQRSETADSLTDWNTIEIIVRGNSATQIVNGKTLMHVDNITTRATPDNPALPITEGRIGFQCQGAEMYLRNLQLKQLN